MMIECASSEPEDIKKCKPKNYGGGTYQVIHDELGWYAIYQYNSHGMITLYQSYAWQAAKIAKQCLRQLKKDFNEDLQ